jgi:hypothetical protein
MMFTSMSPLRRHKDPRPYKIIETGQRVDQSAFGTPGVTIVFDPRAKYMPANRLPVNHVLELVRDYYVAGGSSWSSSMTWLAIVAGVTNQISIAPVRWRTDLPTAELGLLEELVEELGAEKILPQLLHAGDVLQRIADLVEAAGMSYELERKHHDDD